jgi:hypothetical protein
MKHSALALALLASRISSSAGQGGGGGGGGGGAVVPRYEKISPLRRAPTPPLSPPPRPREKKETKEEKNEVFEDEDVMIDDIITQTGCYPLSDIECDNARNCQWCEEQCIGRDEACPFAETTSPTPRPREKKETKETKNKVVEVFDFAGGTTLTLSSEEVDKTFCDASSPISLAGYMNGE